jgi:hemerythrin-like metal-binding protein
VARWGGEEFAVVAPMTDADGAARMAEKVRSLMEVTHLGLVGAVTASFGVTEMRPDDTIEAMLHRADEALYRAKNAGRNRVQCAESWVEPIRAGAAGAPERDHLRTGDVGEPPGTGFAPMDEEHLSLTSGLAAFVGMVRVGRSDEVRPVLAALVAAVEAHFAHEEAMMRALDYPLHARHEEAHALFIGDARRFQAELEREGITPNVRRWALGRLLEWFRYHILAHDVGLGQFLSKAGAVGWLAAVPSSPSGHRKEGVGP